MERESSASMAELVGWWRVALRRTVGEDRQLTVLYSGGLDSSLVAAGLRPLADVELVTVGAPGSVDLTAAERGAHLLGLRWTSRTVRREDVDRMFETAGRLLAQASPASRAVQVGLALALETAAGPHVVCGQGADELFLGYAHFEGLGMEEATKKRAEDLDKLLKDDWPLSTALAEHQGKRLTSPFLEPEFFGHARALSIEQLRNGPGRKPLLRALASACGLPAELADRPKKAFQYGSGIDRMLRPSGPARGP